MVLILVSTFKVELLDFKLLVSLKIPVSIKGLKTQLSLGIRKSKYLSSISSIKQPDRFAQTLINLEFSNGSIDLDYNYKITLHKNKKKKIYDGKPKKYKWISKPWDQIQESVINTHKHFIHSLINKVEHDTSGADNIKSLSLVFNSYKSNKLRKEIKIN